MAFIRQYNKATDTVYVYEQHSQWIPELKQSRSKRRLVGKIDPVSGEIIPTGKRGRPRKNQTASSENCISSETQTFCDSCESILALKTAAIADAEKRLQLEKTICEQKEEISTLNSRICELEQALSFICDFANDKKGGMPTE